MRTRGLLTLLSLVAGLTVLVAPSAHAAVTINVPGDQPTIQSAVNAAANGDTVLVAPGTYFEHVDFKGKAIVVRSAAGAQTAIIDGGGTDQVVVFRAGEGRSSVLRGFTITHGLLAGGFGLISGAGIGIDHSSPTVTQNIIKDNDADGHSGGGIGVVVGAPRAGEQHDRPQPGARRCRHRLPRR